MKPASLVVALAALVFSGCGEEEKAAAEYAKELAAVLKSYQEQLNQKLKAEQASYKELARIYADFADRDAVGLLRTERSERAGRLADRLIASSQKPMSPSAVQEFLRDYAEEDFDRSKRLLERDLDSYNRYLVHLARLEADSKSVEALIEVLSDLGEGNDFFKQARSYAAFVGKSRDCLDEKLCADLAGEIGRLNKELAKPNLEEQSRKSIQDQVRKLEERQKTKDCARKPKCAG